MTTHQRYDGVIEALGLLLEQAEEMITEATETTREVLFDTEATGHYGGHYSFLCEMRDSIELAKASRPSLQYIRYQEFRETQARASKVIEHLEQVL